MSIEQFRIDTQRIVAEAVRVLAAQTKAENDAASGTHEEITAGVDGNEQTGPHRNRGRPPYGRWTVS